MNNRCNRFLFIFFLSDQHLKSLNIYVTKIGLQLSVHETQSLFVYYYLLIIVYFHMNNCKPTFAPPCIHSITKVFFLIMNFLESH